MSMKLATRLFGFVFLLGFSLFALIFFHDSFPSLVAPSASFFYSMSEILSSHSSVKLSGSPVRKFLLNEKRGGKKKKIHVRRIFFFYCHQIFVVLPSKKAITGHFSSVTVFKARPIINFISIDNQNWQIAYCNDMWCSQPTFVKIIQNVYLNPMNYRTQIGYPPIEQSFTLLYNNMAAWTNCSSKL